MIRAIDYVSAVVNDVNGRNYYSVYFYGSSNNRVVISRVVFDFLERYGVRVSTRYWDESY
jgi:hypothetical protein